MSKRTAAEADLDAAVALFEQLPADVVARILINVRLLRLNTLSLNHKVREKIAKAVLIPTFFQRLTLACFPATTRLPFDAQYLLDKGDLGPKAFNTAWRLHLARLIGLVRKGKIAFHDYDEDTNNIHAKEIPINRGGQMATCGDVISSLVVKLPSENGGEFGLFLGKYGGALRVPIVFTDDTGEKPWLYVLSEANAVGTDVFYMDPSKMTDDDVTKLIVQTATFVQPSPVHSAFANPYVTVNIYGVGGYIEHKRVNRASSLLDMMKDTAFNRGTLSYRYGTETVQIELTKFANPIWQPVYMAPMHAPFWGILPIEVASVTVHV